MRQYLSGGRRGPNFSGISGRAHVFFFLAISSRNYTNRNEKCKVAVAKEDVVYRSLNVINKRMYKRPIWWQGSYNKPFDTELVKASKLPCA